MAGYGFVTTSSNNKSKNSTKNDWNQGDWSNAPAGPQASQAAMAGMQAQQQQANDFAAARSAFDGGNSAFGASGQTRSLQPGGFDDSAMINRATGYESAMQGQMDRMANRQPQASGQPSAWNQGNWGGSQGSGEWGSGQAGPQASQAAQAAFANQANQYRAGQAYAGQGGVVGQPPAVGQGGSMLRGGGQMPQSAAMSPGPSSRMAARPASTYASGGQTRTGGGGTQYEYNPYGTPDQPAGLMGEYSQSPLYGSQASTGQAGGGGGYNPQMPNFQQMGVGLSQQDFPQPTIFNSDGSLNAGLFSAGNGLANQSLDWYGAQGNQQTAASYVNTMQNLYNIYNQDREFQTNQTRWLAEAQQSQWRDQQQANLENSRLGLDAWTAQTADRQWRQQFDLESQSRDRQFNLDQQAQNWTEQYQQGQLDLGGRDADTAQYVAEGNRQYQQGQLDVANRGADTNQYEAETGRMLGQEQNRITDWYNRQRVGIEQQAAKVDEMYKSGLINNQQRELALKELTQQQDNTFRQAQMAQEESQFGRTLASTEQYRQLQAQIEREQMANAYRTAVMNAVGRNQAQNVRFLRG